MGSPVSKKTWFRKAVPKGPCAVLGQAKTGDWKFFLEQVLPAQLVLEFDYLFQLKV
jgi:hypothetical protein